ncbi:retrovirus-related pol polyprotein LINE-1, partial [Tanacetum coccineum]
MNRVGSWNVGSLTEKLLKLFDVLGRNKVDIACFQETKLKGSSTMEGNVYKLWYSGYRTRRNGVRVILAARLKDKVVQVTRRSGGDLNNHIEAAVDSTWGYTKALAIEPGMRKDARLTNATWRPRILWKNLNGNLVKTFRSAIYEKICALVEDTSASDACQMWNTLACIIKDTTKDSTGVTSETMRTHSTHMESWWFSKEVQPKVAAKQSKFKKILSCREGNHEDIVKVKERYKLDKREAKIVVALAKDKAYEDLYKKLDSK